jgi:RimJ/RimL family protein N-acetyltransferase
MKPPETPLSIRSLPREFHTKTRQPVRLELLGQQLHPRLVEMYLAFQPRGSIQGLPPIRDSECVKWVQEVIRTGINIVAMSCEQDIVGHIVVFPVTDKKCEMLVVVRPVYQDMGIGTELVRGCIQVACELRFEQMWLPVAAANTRARHVYKKCGFEYASDAQAREIDMMCDLKRM